MVKDPTHEARLAAALRDNLKRRKDQARAREQVSENEHKNTGDSTPSKA